MKIDGRKLSHAQLEAIRFQAVKAVQAGQPPTAVARALGLYPARVFVWLAAYRAGGWDALRARKASGRPKRLTGSQLRWIYNTVTSKNPLQLQFPFALWTRAMIGTLNSAPIRHQAQCDLGGSIVGANGVELPKAAEPGVRAGCDAGQAMDRAGFSQDFALWRKSSVLSCFLPMRAACDLTFMPGRPGGYAGKPLLSATLANAFISICCLRSRPKANCGS